MIRLDGNVESKSSTNAYERRNIRQELTCGGSDDEGKEGGSHIAKETSLALMRLTSPRSLFTASPLRSRMSSSDYGSEPEWTDPTVEAQLRQVEATSPSRTRQAPARIEVAVEGLAVPFTSRLSASPTRRASSTGATAPVRSPW
jgi:hypothetical protein